ncbi:MAG: hypothetical protein KDB23_29330, partial [Planctomycetales bacterium]|nr:hypothetical protein [Planctomycetales bacterium]
MCALPKSLLIRLLVLVGIVWSISVDTSVAQMFGPRQIGSPISPRSGPSTAGGTGTLRNQRFLRGNRSRSNFVGTDRTESRQFVGLQQSTGGGSTRSAVAGLGTGGDPSTQLNQVYPRTGTGVLYAPRFEVEFGHGEIAAREISAQLTQRLARLSNSIEVSVEDRVATLRG